MRVWKFDTNIGSLKTSKRVKYITNKVNKLVFVKSKAIIDIFEEEDKDKRCVVS